MVKQRYTQSYEIKPISSGYLISYWDRNYDSQSINAFKNWDEVMEFLEDNRPKVVEYDYNTSSSIGVEL